MPILVVNPGSSSLKLAVIDGDDTVVDCAVSSPSGALDPDALEDFLGTLPRVDATGVRFVHGGSRLRQSVAVDSGVLASLASVADLAPLHNPPALAALRTIRGLLPTVPLIACFDTTFFSGLPAAAATYALPRRWVDEWGVRRLGFHGLSHSWASRRAVTLFGRSDGSRRIVTCHLGAGASLAAVADGSPVDTTMGFTPLDGLVMATRSGTVDPGILLWVQRHHDLSVHDLERVLDRESGLLGLSGVSGDVRDVIEAADRGDDAAGLALAVYLHRLRGSVAAMAAALGGLDGLVFTGGVGEHSARVRAECCDGLGFLGVGVDPDANTSGSGPDRDITASGCPGRVLVIAAREDLEIAREVRRLTGAEA